MEELEPESGVGVHVVSFGGEDWFPIVPLQDNKAQQHVQELLSKGARLYVANT